MVAPRKSLRAWCSLRALKLLTSLVRSSTLMAAFWPKEALSRVFKETDGPVSRQTIQASLRQNSRYKNGDFTNPFRYLPPTIGCRSAGESLISKDKAGRSQERGS